MLTVRRITGFLSTGVSHRVRIVRGGRENHVVTTVEKDRIQARIDGLLQVLRDAKSDFRRSDARVLDVVAELDAERAGAVTGFGTTGRQSAGVLTSPRARPKLVRSRSGCWRLAGHSPETRCRPRCRLPPRNSPLARSGLRDARAGHRARRHPGRTRRAPGSEHDRPVGQKDQLDAARDDLIGAVEKTRANQGDSALPNNLAGCDLGMIMAGARWLHGHARICLHNPRQSSRSPCTWHCATRPGGMRRRHPPTRGARAPRRD
jgi:hypothetical protein